MWHLKSLTGQNLVAIGMCQDRLAVRQKQRRICIEVKLFLNYFLLFVFSKFALRHVLSNIYFLSRKVKALKAFFFIFSPRLKFLTKFLTKFQIIQIY